MYNKNDILIRLKNGETADNIASEMAEVLNSALDQKRAEDEAAAKANKFQKQKEEAADRLADHINEFFKTYYSDIVKEDEPVTGESILDMIDTVFATFARLENAFNKLIPEVKETSGKSDAPIGKKEVTTTSDDNIIDKFLKDFNLM